MSTGVSMSPDRAKWQALYWAVLQQLENKDLAERIRLAEQAIVERERELGQSGRDNIDEQVVLEDALYTLSALRKTCEFGYKKPSSNVSSLALVKTAI
ncbi:MAG: hypothetical protein DMG68_06225 [Acidobacteria bacterium]|nr:MAG: hypothetical protein DMG68_06225 [Acidobacteriota bacterium]